MAKIDLSSYSSNDPCFERISYLVETLSYYFPDDKKHLFENAFNLATLHHKGQVRKSGEPYIIHPLEVANILISLNLDSDTLVAAIFHDLVEDTDVTLDEIREKFSNEIAELVDGVTKISKIFFNDKYERNAENFRKMLLAMAKDLRVILIKLADRLHNMRTLEHMPANKQRSISHETLDIYAPIANRLGISWIKQELEDLSLKYIKPDIFSMISEKVQQTKNERSRYINEVIHILNKQMIKYEIKCKITGRPKHFYSIYKKMESRNVDFDQIYDIIAFRIVVDGIKDCYEVLGVIHSMWKPVPGRFKDYIAIPKANMYQSLHTTVIGPYGERIEIQIRTEDMHKIAECGVAAHWSYKEKIKQADKDAIRFNWLRQMVELQSDLKDPTAFLESVKVDLFADEVYVFTPKGEVKQFARGSTPIDFAYAVHTEIGNRCVGSKVNGKIVPLKYKLQNGDTVEVITKEGHIPKKDWLKYVVTSKAKTKIRQIITQEERHRSKAIGKEIFEKELKKHSMTINSIERKGILNQILEETRYNSLDELLIGIGYGKIRPKQLLKKFTGAKEDEKGDDGAKTKTETSSSGSESRTSKSPIVVKGVDDILIRFGKCCTPLKGDPIVGFITRGRGITVHTTDCPKILEMDSDRKIDVEWDKSEKSVRKVKIRVLTQDFPGVLAKMSKTITNAGGNIATAAIRTTKDRKAVSIFEISFASVEQLNMLIAELERINEVIAVERLKL